MISRAFSKKILVVILILFSAISILIFKIRQSSSSIENLIAKEHFTDIHEIKTVLNIPEQNITIFDVTYGKPEDCMAGCIYKGKEGIKNGTKIDWIGDYDLDARDKYLFTDEFYSKLTTARGGWYRDPTFDHLFAKDKDTPIQILNTLISLAEKSDGYTGIEPYLLENPAVQTNPDLLKRLLALKFIREEDRQKAGIYLNKLRNGSK